MPKQEKIKVIIENPPTKETAQQKTKELSKFLSKTWQKPVDKSKA